MIKDNHISAAGGINSAVKTAKLANSSDFPIQVECDSLEQVKQALKAGVSRNNIIWDPGLGFAKTTNQNLLILKNLEQFSSFGFPLLIGASRKRFIGEITNEVDPVNRIWGTIAVTCRCVQA